MNGAAPQLNAFFWRPARENPPTNCWTIIPQNSSSLKLQAVSNTPRRGNPEFKTLNLEL